MSQRKRWSKHFQTSTMIRHVSPTLRYCCYPESQLSLTANLAYLLVGTPVALTQTANVHIPSIHNSYRTLCPHLLNHILLPRWTVRRYHHQGQEHLPASLVLLCSNHLSISLVWSQHFKAHDQTSTVPEHHLLCSTYLHHPLCHSLRALRLL